MAGNPSFGKEGEHGGRAEESPREGGLVIQMHLPRVFGRGEAICLPRSAGV